MGKTIPGHMARPRSLFHEPVLRPLILGALFVAALCLRLYGIDKPPMDFTPIRQDHGALLARGLYEWLTTGAMRTLPPDGIIEPPILEFAASLSYLITGGEDLWIPRLLSVLFWMLGGVFLYLIAKRLVSPNAAIFSVFFYLFVPFSVLASRAFMPDPLMVMMLLAGILTILRYHERPSTRRLLVAAVVSSLAVFVKPGICLFQILGAFAALTAYRQGLRKAVVGLSFPTFAVLAILPTGLYYLYGTILAEFLQGQAQTKVVPAYVLDPYYWKGWLHSIGEVVGHVAFAGALLGILLCHSGVARVLLAGLWGGYFVFGLVFTYHIQTHVYYSLQLVPVVALSLGSLWDVAARFLRQADPHYYRRTAILGLAVLAALVGVNEHRQIISGIAQQAQGKDFPGEYVGHTLVADYEARAEMYREIGEVVHHSRHTILWAPEAGYTLVYHGRIDGAIWPNSGLVQWWRSDERAQLFMQGMLSMDEWPTSPKDEFGRSDYFTALRSSDAPPEYFIVIKRFEEQTVANWKEDKVLSGIAKDFRVVAKDDDYVVFDLMKKRG